MIFLIEPITINNLTFAYPGQAPLFKDCSLNLSSDWKLGLLGRNGCIKTTFFKILQNCLDYRGQVQTNLKFGYYPFDVADPDDFVWNNLSNMAPQLEQWQVERELNLIHTDSGLLWQPFNTLSGGEQTRVMLAYLLKKGSSPCLMNRQITLIKQNGH